MPRDAKEAAKERTSTTLLTRGRAARMCLYAKIVRPRERIFFIRPQALVASSKNASAYDEWSSGQIIYAYVGGNPINRVDPNGLLDFVFNTGFHLPAFPLFGVAAGPTASSTWTSGTGSFDGVAGEAVLGAIADVGASAGVAGLSNCPSGRSTSINLGLGRYGGIQLNFKGGQFDGITFGLGVGISLPVTFTVTGPSWGQP